MFLPSLIPAPRNTSMMAGPGAAILDQEGKAECGGFVNRIDNVYVLKDCDATIPARTAFLDIHMREVNFYPVETPDLLDIHRS